MLLLFTWHFFINTVHRKDFTPNSLLHSEHLRPKHEEAAVLRGSTRTMAMREEQTRMACHLIPFWRDTTQALRSTIPVDGDDKLHRKCSYTLLQIPPPLRRLISALMAAGKCLLPFACGENWLHHLQLTCRSFS